MHCLQFVRNAIVSSSQSSKLFMQRVQLQRHGIMNHGYGIIHTRYFHSGIVLSQKQQNGQSSESTNSSSESTNSTAPKSAQALFDEKMEYRQQNSRFWRFILWFNQAVKKRYLTKEVGQLQEFLRDREISGSRSGDALIPIENARSLHRFKTTSLSTKRSVLQDEATRWSAMLVQITFRKIAMPQLLSWGEPFDEHIEKYYPGLARSYLLIVNESWSHQAVSGFAQSSLRKTTPTEDHDFVLSYNAKDEVLVGQLTSRNRLYGHVLLVDRNARIRWAANGRADAKGLEILLKCTDDLIKEDSQSEPQ